MFYIVIVEYILRLVTIKANAKVQTCALLRTNETNKLFQINNGSYN